MLRIKSGFLPLLHAHAMLFGQLLILLQISLGVFPLLVADLTTLLQPSHHGRTALLEAAEAHAVLRHVAHGSGLLHHRSGALARITGHAAHLLLGAATGLPLAWGSAFHLLLYQLFTVPRINILRHRAIHQRRFTRRRRRRARSSPHPLALSHARSAFFIDGINVLFHRTVH